MEYCRGMWENDPRTATQILEEEYTDKLSRILIQECRDDGETDEQILEEMVAFR